MGGEEAEGGVEGGEGAVGVGDEALGGETALEGYIAPEVESGLLGEVDAEGCEDEEEVFAEVGGELLGRSLGLVEVEKVFVAGTDVAAHNLLKYGIVAFVIRLSIFRYLFECHASVEECKHNNIFGELEGWREWFRSLTEEFLQTGEDVGRERIEVGFGDLEESRACAPDSV